MDNAEQLSILGNGERRAARLCDGLGNGIHLARHVGTDLSLARGGGPDRGCLWYGGPEIVEDGLDRAFADPRAIDLDTAHAALRRKWDELGAELVDVAPANAVFFLGQNHDGTALRRLVGKRGKLRRVRKLLLA